MIDLVPLQKAGPLCKLPINAFLAVCLAEVDVAVGTPEKALAGLRRGQSRKSEATGSSWMWLDHERREVD